MNKKLTRLLLIIICCFIYIYIQKSRLYLGYKNDRCQGCVIKDSIADASTNELMPNIIIEDVNGDTLCLKKLIDNDKLVILKLTIPQCSYCIDHALYYFNLYSDDNYVILFHFNNKREVIAYKEVEKLRSNYYFTYEDLPLSADRFGYPYVIITDSSLITQDIFIPDKSLYQRTDNYFRKISTL
ncbi:hypothetical protein OAT16_04755 [Prolixibacteraceae bacterium]|nr:hypothetical protein [Prolixibacteraceae bacterium]